MTAITIWLSIGLAVAIVSAIGKGGIFANPTQLLLIFCWPMLVLIGVFLLILEATVPKQEGKAFY